MWRRADALGFGAGTYNHWISSWIVAQLERCEQPGILPAGRLGFADLWIGAVGLCAGWHRLPGVGLGGAQPHRGRRGVG